MKGKAVPNRDKRAELLKELAKIRFQKDLADEFGSIDLVAKYADEEKQIELEIKQLSEK